jgi:hypothetical protein
MAAVTIFEQWNFQGLSQVLPKGRYDYARNEISIGNDTLSSLKVPPGLVARLYDHYHFQGRFIDITQDTPAISLYWNDRTSSIVIYAKTDPPPVIKDIVIFSDANYQGNSQSLQPGTYDAAQISIGNDTLSSAFVPYGMVLRLFEHANFQGAFIELREDTPAISMDWNDRNSSIVVYEAEIGLWQISITNAAIIGESTESNGIRGISHAAGQGASAGAIVGLNDNSGSGVVGISNAGVGVYGQGGRVAGFFEGDVEVTGDIRLTNADCAEDFNILDSELVEPGTVLVLGDEDSLKRSEYAYDKRVAGVISGAGDFKPGIVLDKQPNRGNRSPVALLGKVFCKVDARYAPIQVGDLLTTSDTPGHAMKAVDLLKSSGSVIGKALRPLAEGQGLIPILITLQ